MANGDNNKTSQKKGKNRQPPKEETSTSTNNDNNSSNLQLLERILALETRIEELESHLEVTKRVNSMLSQEVDDLQQYQRRACIVVDGISTSPEETADQMRTKVKNVLTRNLGFEEAEVQTELDKCHRIGPIKDNNKQSTIIRFKSHSFREKVYSKRKSRTNKKLKLKLSLTKRRTKLINYAHQVTSTIEEVNFVFADTNGNLKLRLKEPIGNKYVYSFKSKEDLLDLFQQLEWEQPRIDDENSQGNLLIKLYHPN